MKPAHQAELKRSERDFRCQSGAKLSAAMVKMSYATSMGREGGVWQQRPCPFLHTSDATVGR